MHGVCLFCDRDSLNFEMRLNLAHNEFHCKHDELRLYFLFGGEVYKQLNNFFDLSIVYDFVGSFGGLGEL